MTDTPVIRCRGRRHALVVAPEIWEIKCGSRVCGAGDGVVVLHRFSTVTGNLLETLKFKDPAWRKQVSNGTNIRSTSVRST